MEEDSSLEDSRAFYSFLEKYPQFVRYKRDIDSPLKTLDIEELDLDAIYNDISISLGNPEILESLKDSLQHMREAERQRVLLTDELRILRTKELAMRMIVKTRSRLEHVSEQLSSPVGLKW
eukprot:GHVR01030901.1.p1 GENE.GHVR01030901.1~~GHVR01030901.1.p1  ORF type:complete len:121 (+),score=14.13 GHVR01030901.1:14-376(+)